MTDGILLAETQARPRARRLRHDHRRRGARAQPQHRLPARLPQAACCARRAGPQARSSRRRRSTPSASRGTSATATRPAPVIEVSGPHVSGRASATAPLGDAATTRPTTRRSSRRRSSPRPRTCGAKVRATSSCSCRASARSARRRRSAARASCARRPYARDGRDPAAVRAAVRRRAAARVRAVARPAHRARDQRRRDVADGARHPLRDRHRARARQALQRCATRRRCCRSRRSRRRRRTSAPAAAAASPTASACASTREDDFAARPRYTDPEILRASLARGDPADGGARPRRGRRVSVRRAAGAARDRRRLPAAAGARRGRSATRAHAARPRARAAAARSAHRPHRARRRASAAASPRRWSSRARSSVPDPRERPLERAQAADQAHLQFRDERSDFLSLVALWEFFRRRARARSCSHRQARRCAAARSSFRILRLREWRDVHAQLARPSSPKRAGRWTPTPAGDDRRAALRDDPQGAAGRTARQHRHEKRGRRTAYHGRARHPLPPASGLGPRERRRRNGCSPRS